MSNPAKLTGDNPWEVDLCAVPFDLPRQCCCACLFPWCVAARQRLQLLGPTGQYVPCEGILCCTAPQSRACLFFEVLLCLDVAITGNRRILQKRDGLIQGRFDSVCCMMTPGSDRLCRNHGRGDTGDCMAWMNCIVITAVCCGYYTTLVCRLAQQQQQVDSRMQVIPAAPADQRMT